ncbi:hypothetical protein PHAVU_008G088600 [Phaseolus vulgaris]|uniref:Uncharacterized protein n=1 Tax=Phaseolus vulgaris TaxID=3885 RepID=V7B3N8_PHAVU|nr:hypothetical protein PHAVU_008G088600g [Phaseolus vulgaris]ESW12150.1 hypothetical protein PHAVU_008G088600g [Phaseolus vulgaris]
MFAFPKGGCTYIFRHMVFNENASPFSTNAKFFLQHNSNSPMLSSTPFPLTMFKVVFATLDKTPDIPVTTQSLSSPIPNFVALSNLPVTTPTTTFDATTSSSPSHNVHPMVTHAKSFMFKPKPYNVSVSDNYIEPATFK